MGGVRFSHINTGEKQKQKAPLRYQNTHTHTQVDVITRLLNCSAVLMMMMESRVWSTVKNCLKHRHWAGFGEIEFF